VIPDSIDPTIPVSFVGGGEDFQYRSTSIGVITVDVGGGTFSQPITFIQSLVGTGFDYSWSAQQGPNDARILSFNGTPVSGAMSLRFVGSTTSTGAILPESLSSYTSSVLRIDAQTPDMTFNFRYFGSLISFTQIASSDSLDEFSFVGSVTTLDIFGPFPGSVPVHAPFAGAGLPGLIFASGGLLGWWRRRRQLAFTPGTELSSSRAIDQAGCR